MRGKDSESDKDEENVRDKDDKDGKKVRDKDSKKKVQTYVAGATLGHLATISFILTCSDPVSGYI